jgi:AcrR family transcriptional regulator
MNRTGRRLTPAYRRLPHGLGVIGREEVARKQRTRLYSAMIEAIPERGYDATTLAHVIALAGVPRHDFYGLFPNKEQCFLATYDIVVARARMRVLDAWTAERGWANRLHASCKTLLDDVAASPNGPHLVLVDALGIGPKARERMLLASLTFERLVNGAFELAPDGIGFPRLTARGIVGGMRHVIFTRLLEQRERELYTLTDEALDWIESYRTPAAARLGVPAPLNPIRQPPVPAAFLTRDEERARVQFPSEEQCFLAVLDEFAREALDAVRPRFESASTWTEGVYQAMAAFVEYLVAHEALLRIVFIDSFEVGPAITGRITRSAESFTKLLIENGPEPRRGPQVAHEAITGAVWSIISGYVPNGRLSRLPCLVDYLAFIVLAPYVGPKAAVEAIQGSRKP